MKSPCKKDCPDRSPTCHAECEAYLAYHEHNRKKNEARLKDGEVLQYIKSQVELTKRK